MAEANLGQQILQDPHPVHVLGMFNPLRTDQGSKLYIKLQFVPHREHTASIRNTFWGMLYSDILAVYCDNHTEYINTPYGQNAECINIISSGTYIYHWSLDG
jgi:hypothetical protein